MTQRDTERPLDHNGNFTKVPLNGNRNGTPHPAGAAMVATAPSNGAFDAAGTSQIEPKALLNAFRRRWFLALTLGLLCGSTAAAAVYFFVPPQFIASSLVYISAVQPHVMNQAHQSTQDFRTYKQTETFRIKTRFVLNAALNSDVRNAELQRKGWMKISDLEMVRNHLFPLVWLQRELLVSNQGDEFIRISLADSEWPRELAEVVNAVTTAYLREVANKEKSQRHAKLEQLQKLLDDQEDKIQEKRKGMRGLAKVLGSADPQALTAIQQMEIEFQTQLLRETNQLKFDLMKLRVARTAKGGTPEDSNGIAIDDSIIERYLADEPEILAKKSKIASLEGNIRLMQDSVERDDHPGLVKLRKKLKVAQTALDELQVTLTPKVEQLLRDQMISTYAETEMQLQLHETQLTKQLELMQQQLAGQDQKAENVGVGSFELETMRAEYDRFKHNSEQVAEELHALKVELDSDDRIKLEQTAEVPRFTDMEGLYKKTAVAGFGVFFIVIAIVVWVEFQAKRINSVTDVAGGLSMRIMGALPCMPRWTNGKKTSKSKAARSAFWHSVLTESIDATRTVLIRDANVESTRLVMIASAIASEGKTTLSCHLAASLARVGRKTLLVDCDFRRSNVHKVFGVKAGPGISEVLLGQCTLEEAIQTASEDGPSILPAGSFNTQLLAALAQDGLAKIFEQLKQEYDFVVVDSSPLLPVTDSLMVAQHVDAVILTIRREVSRKPKVVAACERLNMLGVPMLGTVVIGLDSDSYGYRRGYGGQYRYGYRYGYHYNRIAEDAIRS